MKIVKYSSPPPEAFSRAIAPFFDVSLANIITMNHIRHSLKKHHSTIRVPAAYLIYGSEYYIVTKERKRYIKIESLTPFDDEQEIAMKFAHKAIKNLWYYSRDFTVVVENATQDDIDRYSRMESAKTLF